jgi:hypothetical protein
VQPLSWPPCVRPRGRRCSPRCLLLVLPLPSAYNDSTRMRCTSGQEFQADVKDLPGQRRAASGRGGRLAAACFLPRGSSVLLCCATAAQSRPRCLRTTLSLPGRCVTDIRSSSDRLRTARPLLYPGGGPVCRGRVNPGLPGFRADTSPLTPPALFPPRKIDRLSVQPFAKPRACGAFFLGPEAARC